MIWLNGHVLLHFDLVHGLEDGEAMADTVQAHVFKIDVLQGDQGVAGYALFCIWW